MKALPTDWDAIRFSTLWNGVGAGIGAGVGALIGGTLSYLATVKANFKFERSKKAEQICTLAKHCKEELYELDLKRAMNAALTTPVFNMRTEMEGYKNYLDQLVLLIELHFPKDESLTEDLSRDVRKFFNDRATKPISQNPEIAGELRSDLEHRLELISNRFKKEIT